MATRGSLGSHWVTNKQPFILVVFLVIFFRYQHRSLKHLSNSVHLTTWIIVLCFSWHISPYKLHTILPKLNSWLLLSRNDVGVATLPDLSFFTQTDFKSVTITMLTKLSVKNRPELSLIVLQILLLPPPHTFSSAPFSTFFCSTLRRSLKPHLPGSINTANF